MPKYKAGDVLHGYRLLAPFRIAGGGNCEWTFAERGEEEFFIKNFFTPKYPVPRDGRPPAGNAAERRARCEEFESIQNRLLREARRVAGKGGRLVVPTDFFREGTTYYKVAQKIDVAGLEVAEIARLPFEQRQRIMATVVSALYALHNAGIVHGDLSPGNILIAADGDGFRSHVIDFDSSYLEAEVPPKDETMGNPPYYSPELLTYMQEEDGDRSKMTTRSDIFALGVVFWQYLYGGLPQAEPPFHYAAEMVRAGRQLVHPRTSDVPPGAVELLKRMLSADPADRPSMGAVQQAIKRGFPSADPAPAPVVTTPAPPGWPTPPVAPADPARPRVKGSMTKRALRPAVEVPPPPTDPSESRIKFRRRGDDT